MGLKHVEKSAVFVKKNLNTVDVLHEIKICVFVSDMPILQILESRTNDRQAIEFVKKQKLRFANK